MTSLCPSRASGATSSLRTRVNVNSAFLSSWATTQDTPPAHHGPYFLVQCVRTSLSFSTTWIEICGLEDVRWAQGLAHYSKCNLKEKLWLYLICGALGCRHKFYALVGTATRSRILKSQHPVCVNLGLSRLRATPVSHILHLCRLPSHQFRHQRSDAEKGGKVDDRAGTFVSLEQQKLSPNDCDQQIEHILNFGFSLTDEAGNAFEPVLGASMTGLQNLGNRCISFLASDMRNLITPNNSCYMASVNQVLFALPPFQQRYAAPRAVQHWIGRTKSLPASCLECQMVKLADGLLSEQYSTMP
jgi:ubiquitin carboxyl-terminal hydrolase 5/13